MVTAVAALFATGCTEQIEPEATPVLSGQQVYMTLDQTTEFVIGKNVLGEGAESYVEIPVYRLVTDTEYTVNMRFGTSEGFEADYTAPKFAVGEKEAKLIVTFDATQLEPGEKANFFVKFSEEFSDYGLGKNEVTFVVENPEPFNAVVDPVDPQIDYGTYVDDFFLPLLSNPSGIPAPAYFERHAENPNLIRVVEPFGAHVWTYWYGGVDAVSNVVTLGAEPAYLVFDITDPENVVMQQNPCHLGFKAAFDGFVDVYMVVATPNAQGQLDTSVPGMIKYADGAIYFEPGCVFVAYDAGEEGLLSIFAQANMEGMMQYILPGGTAYERGDYSLGVSYGGMFVDNENNTSAVLNFTPGADVASYKFTVLPGNVTADADAIAATIVEGTCESEVVESDASTTQWQISELTGGATYTVVAVVYSEEGDAKSNVSSIFYFPGMTGGNEIPEVEAVFLIDTVANLMGDPAYETNYPSSSVCGIYFQTPDVSAVTGWRMFYNYRETVHGWIDSGEATLEQLVDEAGEDLSSFLDADCESGTVLTCGIEPGDFCFIFALDTIYGKTQYYEVEYSVSAAQAAAAQPGTFSISVLKSGKVVSPFTATPMN